MSEFLENLVSRSISSPAGVSPARILAPRLPGLFEPAAGSELPSVPRAEGTGDQSMESTLFAGLDDNNRSSRLESAKVDGSVGPSGALLKPRPGRGVRSKRPFLHLLAGQPISLDELPSEQLDNSEAFLNLQDSKEREASVNRSNGERKRPRDQVDGERISPQTYLIRPAIAPLQGEMDPSTQVPGSRAAFPVGQAGENEITSRLNISSNPSTVHIRIERIEVRLTPPASQPSPHPGSAPRPKLSLDEYLRQRNEGKR
jgi:hypothetical protein